MADVSTKTAGAADGTALTPLTPPEAPRALEAARAPEMVELSKDTISAVDKQVDAFVDGLLKEDIHGEPFRKNLASAFRLGREEVAINAGMLSGRFMERNAIGIENTSAYQAISEMRSHLDELNPGKQGDLLSANKLLGVIPFGNKLTAYFRRYQAVGAQIEISMNKLYAARDDMVRDEVAIDETQRKLWDAMVKLRGAIHFARAIDTKIAAQIDQIKGTDPNRARALEQEVLFYARQNLQDMLTQMAVSVNAYMALGVLKKTARDMQNGCERVATTGISALTVAQTVARATGNQVAVMEALQKSGKTIEDLIVSSSEQLGTHVEKTKEFSTNPLIAVEALQKSFDTTFKAMDAMDTYRSDALVVMSKTNDLLREQVARSDEYVKRASGGQSLEVPKQQIAGPVAL
jgi:uncharacterized protein YaaN involved in tellurite resistance